MSVMQLIRQHFFAIYGLGVGVYAVGEAILIRLRAEPGLSWLHEAALQTLYAPWWPLLAAYGFPFR